MQRHARGQGLGEGLGNQRIVGAAQDHRIRHCALELRRKVAHRTHDCGLQIGRRGAGFDQADQTGAGLLHDPDLGCAPGDLARVGAARHRAPGREDPDHRRLRARAGKLRLRGRRFQVPGHLGHRLDHGHENAEHAPLRIGAGQPVLLQAPQRHRGGGVAGEQHQPAAAVEQPGHAGAGEVIDFRVRALAVGRVAVIAEIEEDPFGQARDQRAQDREPAVARIEHADHGPSNPPGGASVTAPGRR